MVYYEYIAYLVIGANGIVRGEKVTTTGNEPSSLAAESEPLLALTWRTIGPMEDYWARSGGLLAEWPLSTSGGVFPLTRLGCAGDCRGSTTTTTSNHLAMVLEDLWNVVDAGRKRTWRGCRGGRGKKARHADACSGTGSHHQSPQSHERTCIRL